MPYKSDTFEYEYRYFVETEKGQPIKHPDGTLYPTIVERWKMITIIRDGCGEEWARFMTDDDRTAYEAGLPVYGGMTINGEPV